MSSKLTFISLLTIALLLAGCRAAPENPGAAGVSPAQATQVATAAPAATTTPAPTPTPTQTPEPLALRVNNEGISLAEYQAELSQLQAAQAALGKTVPAEQQAQQVLDNLRDQLLLAQGAVEGGFQLDEEALQAEIASLAQQAGGEQALQAWIAQYGYTEAAFRAALRRQLAAAWQRDQIAAAVPLDAEQVHVRQILTTDEAVANRALELVKIPGTNFAAYAYQYDPLSGGDLGWFPRGYLTQPAVEEAAFSLQPGEISAVVKSEIGYHILQMIAREPARSISPDARRVLQHKALSEWLKARREGASIEVLRP